MHLIYLDESGNSGENLEDKQQPVFVLGALIVHETQWRSIESEIVQKISAYFGGNIPDGFEVHATDIRGGKGVFKKVPVADRIAFRDDLLSTASKFKLKLVYRAITKKRYRAWLDREFGVGITINPHIAAYPLLAIAINDYLRKQGDGQLGIFINDDNKEVVADLERTTKIFRADPGVLQLDRIIEKGFFIDSRKSYLLQLADLCIFHARKFEEIKLGLPAKSFDANAIEIIRPLITRGDEALMDVLTWLAQDKKVAARAQQGAGSPSGGHSRRL